MALETEGIEIQLLLQGIYQRYGYDFRDYAQASIRRRILKRLKAEALPSISALQERVLHDAACMDRLLLDLSVNVSAFFRDPEFFVTIREQVVPHLKTYPFVRIWHAGSAGGEEVYSLAILLLEEGLLDKCRIYATDFNAQSLESAGSGIFPLNKMKDYTRNYIQAGGRASFSDYYMAQYDHAVFKSRLKEQLIFARHNLVTDQSFNEFNLILCRNVMIYFNRELQNKVHGIFYDSLAQWGILGLGKGENLQFTPFESCYEPLDPSNKLFRKIK